jgi:hypothetical protein
VFVDNVLLAQPLQMVGHQVLGLVEKLHKLLYSQVCLGQDLRSCQRRMAEELEKPGGLDRVTAAMNTSK